MHVTALKRTTILYIFLFCLLQSLVNRWLTFNDNDFSNEIFIILEETLQGAPAKDWNVKEATDLINELISITEELEQLLEKCQPR